MMSCLRLRVSHWATTLNLVAAKNDIRFRIAFRFRFRVSAFAYFLENYWAYGKFIGSLHKTSFFFRTNHIVFGAKVNVV